ncbi:MAG: GNAT family N-acetyltransferase [Planctomycetota bacterium]|jgi:GNAT superfamily N-acetyltransferase
MKLRANDVEIRVRAGTADDVPALLSFIRAMAEYEKLDAPVTESLLRESLFGDDAAARTLLAFVDDVPVAYAVYFFTFSTMLGKRGLWLEDLFVSPDARRQGIGTAVLAYLADLAIASGCGRFEWFVLDWNTPAIDLYRSMGATILEEWRLCRLDERGCAEVAERLVRVDERPG